MFERIEIDDEQVQKTMKNKENIDRNISWDKLFFLNTKKKWNYENYEQNIFYSNIQEKKDVK